MGCGILLSNSPTEFKSADVYEMNGMALFSVDTRDAVEDATDGDAGMEGEGSCRYVGELE